MLFGRRNTPLSSANAAVGCDDPGAPMPCGLRTPFISNAMVLSKALRRVCHPRRAGVVTPYEESGSCPYEAARISARNHNYAFVMGGEQELFIDSAENPIYNYIIDNLLRFAFGSGTVRKHK